MMSQPTKNRVINALSWSCLAAGITAAFFLAPSRGTGRPSSAETSATTEVSFETSLPPGVAVRNIEDVRVGDRVLARNPQVTDEERATWGEPDQQSWAFFKLALTKPDEGVLEIEIIRPKAWQPWDSAQVGAFVYLDLPEMGAVGEAEVLDIGPCPEIQQSHAGQVVTATFRHPPSGDVLEVSFESEAAPIGVTANHLFWSVDANDFRPIGEMAAGERLLTYEGQLLRIGGKTAIPRPERVYNLEVYGEHVYFVGAAGLLAHNTYTNQKMRNSVNELDASGYRWYRDPFTNQMKRTRLRLAPDHVFAANSIEGLKGFKKLSRSQQLELLTDMRNIQPLPYRLNSSKGAKTGVQWKTALGKELSPAYRNYLQQRERRMKQYFINRIAELLAG